MIFFKECPRCTGDMHVNSDIYGKYKECLLCGLMLEMKERSRLVKKLQDTKKEASNRLGVA